MGLPFFYKADIVASQDDMLLSEETSRHVVQVLRMQKGDRLKLTDGKGNIFTAIIVDDHKKKCAVQTVAGVFHERLATSTTIAISLLKNTSRFEWFLEKATEIGVNEVIPLVCERTEKQHFRQERLNGILVSAMLQSQQCWLPLLSEPTKYNKLVEIIYDGQKFIAHCLDENNKAALAHKIQPMTNRLILVGPEGDFTHAEIEEALRNNFVPVALGDTRLRTETAGIVAATILRNF